MGSQKASGPRLPFWAQLRKADEYADGHRQTGLEPAISTLGMMSSPFLATDIPADALEEELAERFPSSAAVDAVDAAGVDDGLHRALRCRSPFPCCTSGDDVWLA